MANANPDSTGEETSPTLPPTMPPTVLVLLQCTMTQAVLDHLFAIGAARVLPADAPAPPWLAAAAPSAHADRDPALLVARLSPTQLEIVRLIGQGYTTAAIAKIRHRSTNTIEGQKSRLKKKLGLASPTALAQWAWRFVHRAREESQSRDGACRAVCAGGMQRSHGAPSGAQMRHLTIRTPPSL